MIRSPLAAFSAFTASKVVVNVLATGVALLIALPTPLAAQTSPIYREDVRVNLLTGEDYVNPRVLLVPPDVPAVAGRAPTAGSRRGVFAISDRDPVQPISELRYRNLLEGFEFDPIPEIPLSVSLQWENQVVDLAASLPDGLGNFNVAFAIEYAGVDGSDVGLMLEDGTEVQLDDPVSVNIGFQSNPRLAVSSAGTLAMVYASTHDPATGIPRPSICYVFGTLDADFPGSSAFSVNNVSGSNVLDPAIVFAYGVFLRGVEGRFLVAWESFGSAGNDNSLSSIQARFVGEDGLPIGEQFQVNTAITNFQRKPDVAALSNGEFVIVWHSDESLGDDNSFTSIQARRYDMDGQPLGPEFQVNNEITGQQFQPSVAALDNGGFVVVWSDTPISQTNLSGRLFSAGGVPVADQFRVNTLSGISVDDPPSISAIGNDFLATWGRGGDIYMNGSFFRIFFDGFEASDP